MRHEEVVYECDLCGVQDDAQPTFGGGEGEHFTLPQGWLRVTVKAAAGTPDRIKHAADACSLDCVGKLVTRWRREHESD